MAAGGTGTHKEHGVGGESAAEDRLARGLDVLPDHVRRRRRGFHLQLVLATEPHRHGLAARATVGAVGAAQATGEGRGAWMERACERVEARRCASGEVNRPRVRTTCSGSRRGNGRRSRRAGRSQRHPPRACSRRCAAAATSASGSASPPPWLAWPGPSGTALHAPTHDAAGVRHRLPRRSQPHTRHTGVAPGLACLDDSA